MRRLFAILAASSLFMLPNLSSAQEDKTKFTGENRMYRTVRVVSEKPEIDGVLDDACWNEGEWGGDYRQ